MTDEDIAVIRARLIQLKFDRMTPEEKEKMVQEALDDSFERFIKPEE